MNRRKFLGALAAAPLATPLAEAAASTAPKYAPNRFYENGVLVRTSPGNSWISGCEIHNGTVTLGASGYLHGVRS